MISLRAPRWTAALVALGIVGWAGVASAQTLDVTYSSRSPAPPAGREKEWYIGRSDCLVTGSSLNFTATATGAFSSYIFEVWAGSDCNVYASRSGTSAKCIKLYDQTPKETFTVTLPIQAMVTDPTTVPSGTEVTGDPSACTPTSGTSAAKTLTLYFMLLKDATDESPITKTWTTQYDLIGPEAPTGVTAGFGETMLKIEWVAPDLSDVTAYNFYCYPRRGHESEDAGVTTMAGDAGDLDVNVPEAGAGGAAGAAGSSGAGGAAGAAGSSGAGGAAGSSNSGGAAGSSGAAGAAGSAGSTASLPDNCPPDTPFREGDTPDEAYNCGSVQGGTSGKVTGLQNGVKYAVAVAAVDAFDNVGPLSNIACEAPGPVDDFFDLYKQAGGAGGGGFCALSGVPGGARHAGLAGSLAVLAAAALLRRRARR